MNELVDWLRAQLDEDERAIEASRMGDDPEWWMPTWLTADRLLVEVEAKRRILDEHDEAFAQPWVVMGEAQAVMARVVRVLALPYADRAGYRAEWRPE